MSGAEHGAALRGALKPKRSGSMAEENETEDGMEWNRCRNPKESLKTAARPPIQRLSPFSQLRSPSFSLERKLELAVNDCNSEALRKSMEMGDNRLFSWKKKEEALLLQGDSTRLVSAPALHLPRYSLASSISPSPVNKLFTRHRFIRSGQISNGRDSMPDS